MSGDRRWMYNRMKNGYLTDEFVERLETFVDFACNQVEWMDEDKIRCPCKHRKCQNRNFLQPDEVKYHLARYGFVPDYYIWDRHGEIHVEVDNSNMRCRERAQPKLDYHTMVRDAADHELEPMLSPSNVEESPNPVSKRCYDMLNAADKELWPCCSKHSQLSLESVNSNDPSFTADSNLDEAESNKRIDEHYIYITAVGGIGKKRRGIGSCGIISQLDELRQRFQTFEERFEMMMSRLSTSQSGGEIKLNDS